MMTASTHVLAPVARYGAPSPPPTPPMIILVLGYDECALEKLLLALGRATKIVAFDADNDDNRQSFERYLFPTYGDRVTLYEGDVACNLLAYVKMRPRRDFVFTATAARDDAVVARVRRAIATIGGNAAMTVLIGYNEEAIERIMLAPAPTSYRDARQLVVLDEPNDAHRIAFQTRVFATFGDRVALHEGNVSNRLFAYLCARPNRAFVVYLANEMDGRPRLAAVPRDTIDDSAPERAVDGATAPPGALTCVDGATAPPGALTCVDGATAPPGAVD
jgi:hypothetical protein